MTDKKKYRKTDRQIKERQIDTHTKRQINQTDKQTNRLKKDRQTDRKTDSQSEKKDYGNKNILIIFG